MKLKSLFLFCLLFIVNNNLFSQGVPIIGSTSATVGVGQNYFIGGFECGVPDDCNYTFIVQGGGQQLHIQTTLVHAIIERQQLFFYNVEHTL